MTLVIECTSEPYSRPNLFSMEMKCELKQLRNSNLKNLSINFHNHGIEQWTVYRNCTLVQKLYTWQVAKHVCCHLPHFWAIYVQCAVYTIHWLLSTGPKFESRATQVFFFNFSTLNISAVLGPILFS